MENPFAQRPFSQEFGKGRRRSTRVDFVCPVVVSGRDATGQIFREETETSAVNLHGCKMRLTHQVMVGMVVTLESPHAQTPAKAICVHVWEAGEAAVQLLKPQNLWGLKNPPADWQAVAETQIRGRPAGDAGAVTVTPASMPPKAPSDVPNVAAGPPTAKPIASPVLATPKPSTAGVNTPKPAASPIPITKRPAPTTASTIPFRPAVLQPAAQPTRAASTSPAAAHPTDDRLAELEDRSWQLMDSVLQVLRDQTEELVGGSLEEFRQQVEALVRDAELRLKERAEESYGQVESSIHTLREDLADQLAHRTDEIVESARAALHARVEEMFSTMLTSSQNKAKK